MNKDTNNSTVMLSAPNRKIAISVFLLLVYTLGTNSLFIFLFDNYGIPNLRFQQFWFYLVPGFYILLFAYHNNRLKLVGFIPFIIFYVTHFIMENYFYGSDYETSDPIDLLHRMQGIYFCYIVLVNAGEKYFPLILRTTVWLLIINTTLVYLDIVGLINVGNFSKGFGIMEGRISGSLNLNVVNDMNVFGIYCLFFLKRLNWKGLTINNLSIPNSLIISYLIPLIFLQASRGSFVLLLVGFIIYLSVYWKKLSVSLRGGLILVIIVLIILQVNIVSILSERINVVKRLNELNTEEGSRIYGAIICIESFMLSPIYGVGYNRSMQTARYGLRTNMQYPQILASGGILLAIIYFSLIYMLFINNLKLFLKDKIVYSITIYVLVLFFFRRPDAYLGVAAYIVWFRNINLKSEIMNV